MLIKLSKYAKELGLSYTTCYSMAKNNKLPAKVVVLDTGTILVDRPEKLCCVVKDKGGKKSFTIQIDVDIDSYDLSKEEKLEILNAVENLAYKIAHKIGYQVDEKSVKII